DAEQTTAEVSYTAPEPAPPPLALSQRARLRALALQLVGIDGDPELVSARIHSCAASAFDTSSHSRRTPVICSSPALRSRDTARTRSPSRYSFGSVRVAPIWAMRC